MKSTFQELSSEAPGTLPLPAATTPAPLQPSKIARGPFGQPVDFLGNRFVYAVISQRSHGLSIGINVNPDKRCNFDCAYCEVDRVTPARDTKVDLDIMAAELEQLLTFAFQHRMRDFAHFANVPQELLTLKGVALSGEGEPTLSAQFVEIVREVIHVRSSGRFPFFKIVLITNASGLDAVDVQDGLKLLTSRDEIWAKLDFGTPAYMSEVNRTHVSPEKILSNIVGVARQRPVVIQSLFPMLNGKEPAPEEIEMYATLLNSLKQAGAQITLVQIHSAHRPAHRPECCHLPLRSLSRIAQRVREVTGLKAEVF